jgi:hypothetical protein
MDLFKSGAGKTHKAPIGAVSGAGNAIIQAAGDTLVTNVFHAQGGVLRVASNSFADGSEGLIA